MPYASTYQKYLELSTSVHDKRDFYLLTADEKYLLRSLNHYWIEDKKVTVLTALNETNHMSHNRVFRNLKKLREKGFLSLEVSKTDNRIKYILPTKLTLNYFNEHGKILTKFCSELLKEIQH